MSGEISDDDLHYAVIVIRPDPPTLRAMRKMTSFSFKVLGDGKPHKVKIATTDTLTNDGKEDDYCIMFPTINGQISAITIDVDHLAQEGYGKPAPFILDNVVRMEFFAESPGPFYLKVWDIRIY